jgi:hypothetical protein
MDTPGRHRWPEREGPMLYVAIVANYHEATEIVGIFSEYEVAYDRAAVMGKVRDAAAAVLRIELGSPIEITYPEFDSADWIRSPE